MESDIRRIAMSTNAHILQMKSSSLSLLTATMCNDLGKLLFFAEVTILVASLCITNVYSTVVERHAY